MNRKNLLKSTAAAAAMLAMLSNAAASPDTSLPGISLPTIPDLMKIALLRQKVKYVFVIFHETSPSTTISELTRAPPAFSKPRPVSPPPTKRPALLSAYWALR